MRYIFLDIDGVLNTESSWKLKPYDINKNCIQNLINLCSKDTKIILSSTWKKGFRKEYGECSVQIQELRDILKEFNLDIFDKTPERVGNRELEIESYIKAYGITDYVILDDDMALFPTIRNRLYKVDCRTGLTKDDVNGIKNLERKWT